MPGRKYLYYQSQQPLTLMQVVGNQVEVGNWIRGRTVSNQETDSWSAHCTGQTSGLLAPFLNLRRSTGVKNVDWCLASLDTGVSFTRSQSMAMTSYKQHVCTLDGTGEPVHLYSEAHLRKNKFTIPTSPEQEYAHVHSENILKRGIKCSLRTR